MRNLKRVLALAMAMIMMLGMMVIGTSAASVKSTVPVSDEYAEAVEILSNMGVFKGQANNAEVDFAPKAILTRAEAAALIYRVITGDVTDAQKDNYDYASMKDIKAGQWYTGYVTYANNGGYIKGDENGNFNPNAQVTGIQVIAIMLRAAGYGQNGEYEGKAWKDNILTDAKDLGVIGDISTATLDAPASRELVAQLLFNAISGVKMVTYTPMLGYIPVKLTALENGVQTLGLKVFGLDYVTGVVVANEKVDLADGDARLADGKTALDNKITYTLTTDESVLGAKIGFWAIGTDGKKPVAVSTPDVLTPADDYSNTAYAALTKAEQNALSGATAFYYNYHKTDKSVLDKMGKGVTVKAINNDGKAGYEYVMVVEETFSVVQYISTTGAITLNNYAAIPGYTQVAYEDIAVGDKVLVNSYGGLTYINAAEYVTGFISGYTTSAKANTATIGGETYTVSTITYSVNGNAATQFEKVTDTFERTYNGTTYNYYLDVYGNIIAYAKADELATSYGLILDFDSERTLFSRTLYVKYLTVEGKVETAKVDKYTSIDLDTRHNKGDVIEYRLDENGDFVAVYDNALKTFDNEGAMVATDATYDVAAVWAAESNEPEKYVGLYTVDEDLVAFYYVKDGRHDAYYGVLTGADAIADLAVADISSVLAGRAGKSLAQLDYAKGSYTHDNYLGKLKMVNISAYINPDAQFCYIADTTTVKATTSMTEGRLYHYDAINAAGEKVSVAIGEKLTKDSPKVWAYESYTETYLSNTYTYNRLMAVEELGYTVLYGDLHSNGSKTFRVYDENEFIPVTLNNPEVFANVKGGTTALSETFCATGYVVAEYNLNNFLPGGNGRSTVGEVVGTVIPDTLAAFVTETVDNDVDYVDVSVKLPNDESAKVKHLPYGFDFTGLLQDGKYEITINGTKLTKIFTVETKAGKQISDIAVNANWDKAEVVIEAYEAPDVYSWKLVKTTMDATKGAEIEIARLQNGEKLNLSESAIDNLTIKVTLYNEKSQEVYSTALKATANASGNLVVNVASQLTAGNSYKAVIEIAGAKDGTTTITTAYIEAQEAAPAPTSTPAG